MSDLNSLLKAVQDKVKDQSDKLTPDDYIRLIIEALGRFSKHRPAQAVIDVNGDGTHDCALPDGWISEFSEILKIEYPVGKIPATLLDNDAYELYQSPTSTKIRLRDLTPEATDSIRVTFTVMRTIDTVPDGDVDAFTNLAASFCLEELANAFIQSSDATIGADSVNYRTKSMEAASRAKRLMELYSQHVGVKEIDQVRPASGVIDLDEKYPGGIERLTHQRWARRRR